MTLHVDLISKELIRDAVSEKHTNSRNISNFFMNYLKSLELKIVTFILLVVLSLVRCCFLLQTIRCETPRLGNRYYIALRMVAFHAVGVAPSVLFVPARFRFGFMVGALLVMNHSTNRHLHSGCCCSKVITTLKMFAVKTIKLNEEWRVATTSWSHVNSKKLKSMQQIFKFLEITWRTLSVFHDVC